MDEAVPPPSSPPLDSTDTSHAQGDNNESLTIPEGLTGRALWQARREIAAKKRARNRGGIFVRATTNPLINILMSRQKSGLSPSKVKTPHKPGRPRKSTKTPAKTPKAVSSRKTKRNEPELDDDRPVEVPKTAKKAKRATALPEDPQEPEPSSNSASVQGEGKGKSRQKQDGDGQEVLSMTARSTKKSTTKANTQHLDPQDGSGDEGPVAGPSKKRKAKTVPPNNLHLDQDLPPDEVVVDVSAAKPQKRRKVEQPDDLSARNKQDSDTDMASMETTLVAGPSKKRAARKVLEDVNSDVASNSTKVRSLAPKPRKRMVIESGKTSKDQLSEPWPPKTKATRAQVFVDSSPPPKSTSISKQTAEKRRKPIIQPISEDETDAKASSERNTGRATAEDEPRSDEEITARAPKTQTSAKRGKRKDDGSKPKPKSALSDLSNTSAGSQAAKPAMKLKRQPRKAKHQAQPRKKVIPPNRDFRSRRSMALPHNPYDSEDDPLDLLSR